MCGLLVSDGTVFINPARYRMSEKFCVCCQEVTPHYVNEYRCFECCNCEPMSESDYESDSSDSD